MRTEISSRAINTTMQQERDIEIVEQLNNTMSGISLRSISSSTGYNPETIRRYMRGESRIPAGFIRQIAMHYPYDANTLLCLSPNPETINLGLVATDHLINELGRRMRMIENCAVASVVVNSNRI